jgi:hypothetical protein
MDERPIVYVESTIPSYLTSRPSRQLVTRAHQQVTREWRGTAPARFQRVVSDTVLFEISAGNAELAARRMETGIVIRRLQKVNAALSRETPVIVTPLELLE